MIDVHTHILPGMDDGCGHSDESIRLLQMEVEQGIKAVCLTSHFYARNEDPEHFLERRAYSYSRLLSVIKGNGISSPKLFCGAEVRFFEGIGRSSAVRKLVTEGINCLLLEMPFTHWSDKTVSEVLTLSEDVKIILAHTERLLFYENMDHIHRLKYSGSDIILQSNAEIFIPLSSRRKALKYLNDGYVDLIATDCHSEDRRPPNMEKAMEYISRKAGRDVLEHLTDVQSSLMKRVGI